MKIIVGITHYADNLLEETKYDELVKHSYLEWIMNSYVEQIAKDLGYELLYSTMGRHIDAKVSHYHLNIVMETHNAKVYKDLASRIKKRITITLPSREIVEIFKKWEERKLRLTITNETDERFDEMTLGYPWKEYPNRASIPDWGHRNLTEDKIEQLRKLANDKWNKIVKERNEKQEEELSYLEYIHKNLSIDKEHSYNVKVQATMVAILRFRKQQFHLGKATSIQVSRLKDQATSYLYFHNYITEEEIIINTQRT